MDVRWLAVERVNVANTPALMAARFSQGDLVEFRLLALPPDLTRERKGRPARSPSLPPDEPKPDDVLPPAS